MGRINGLLNIAGNFDVLMASPLDSRDIVGQKADLTDTNIWEANDGTIYAYKGMKVAVIDDTAENNGLYMLKADDYTLLSSWDKLGEGTSGGAINVHKTTTNPTVDDDNGTYLDYTFWINTSQDKVFFLVDGTLENANWIELTGGGSIENVGNGIELVKGDNKVRSLRAGSNINLIGGADEITIISNLTGEANGVIPYENEDNYDFDNTKVLVDGEAKLKPINQPLTENYMLNCNGVDSSILSHTSIWSANQPRTFEGWFYVTQTSKQMCLFDTSGIGDFLITENGGVRVHVGSSIWYDTVDNGVTINQWNHIALVQTGTKRDIYINGELEPRKGTGSGSPDTANWGNATGTLRIGNIGSGRQRFEGLMQEIRVWGKALTKEEIQLNMDNTLNLANEKEDLLIYYPCNDFETPMVATDESGNNKNGTIQSGSVYESSTLSLNINKYGGSQFWSVKTTDDTLNSSDWFAVNALTVTAQQPLDTQIKWLILSDNKTYTRTSGAWVEENDVSNGLTTVELETLFTFFNWDLGDTFGLVLGLKTDNENITPSVDKVEINFLMGQTDSGKVGTKFVDESAIADGKMLAYNGTTDLMEYVEGGTGGTKEEYINKEDTLIYNANNDIIKVETTMDVGGIPSLVIQKDYEYNTSNDIIKETIQDFIKNKQVVNTFSYDGNNNIIKVTTVATDI